MKKKNYFSLLLLLAVCVGCNGNKQNQAKPYSETLSTDTVATNTVNISYFFNGDFVYFADAANFTDCLTGKTFPVAMKDKYIDVEKQYKEMNPSEKEAINCSVMGYFTQKGADEEGENQQLVITSFLGFDRTVGCDPLKKITQNIYACFHPDDKTPVSKTSITFNDDYTYQCSTYQLSPIELLSDYKGHWYRTSEDNIVLLVDDNVLYEGVINFTNMNLELQNDNEQEVIFKPGV